MVKIARDVILERLRAKLDRGEAIIGGGAGTGLSAKFQAAGGVDLLVLYNSGRYRMAGRGSLAGLLAYGNANDVVIDMAKDVLTAVSDTPVMAGVNGTDPFYDPEVFLPELIRLGFSGVQNFPTVGLIDGNFRANLEETGMSYSLEVDLVRAAHRHDLLTTPYVFNVADTEAMVDAGADIVVCHMGLTTGGAIGADTALDLPTSAQQIATMVDAAKSVRADTIVLCHGGPIAEPEDAAFVLEQVPGLHGFYGASSMERLPVETALRQRAQEFSSLRTRTA